MNLSNVDQEIVLWALSIVFQSLAYRSGQEKIPEKCFRSTSNKFEAGQMQEIALFCPNCAGEVFGITAMSAKFPT